MLCIRVFGTGRLGIYILYQQYYSCTGTIYYYYEYLNQRVSGCDESDYRFGQLLSLLAIAFVAQAFLYTLEYCVYTIHNRDHSFYLLYAKYILL